MCLASVPFKMFEHLGDLKKRSHKPRPPIILNEKFSKKLVHGGALNVRKKLGEVTSPGPWHKSSRAEVRRRGKRRDEEGNEGNERKERRGASEGRNRT